MDKEKFESIFKEAGVAISQNEFDKYWDQWQNYTGKFKVNEPESYLRHTVSFLIKKGCFKSAPLAI